MSILRVAEMLIVVGHHFLQHSWSFEKEIFCCTRKLDLLILRRKMWGNPVSKIRLPSSLNE